MIAEVRHTYHPSLFVHNIQTFLYKKTPEENSNNIYSATIKVTSFYCVLCIVLLSFVRFYLPHPTCKAVRI